MLKLIRKIIDYTLIKRSDLFDEEYYCLQYPDVRQADIDPLWHFVNVGWRERRNPSKDFDTNFYLVNYPDVLASLQNPLTHFIRFGKNEGRSSSPAMNVYTDLVNNEKRENNDRNQLMKSIAKKQEADSNQLSRTNHDQLKQNLRLNWTTLQRAFRFINEFGLKEFFKKLRSKLSLSINQSDLRQGGSSFLRKSDDPYYRDWIASFTVAQKSISDDYVAYNPDLTSADNPLVKLVAFYLPQFHPFTENDIWWGKGFTEWTNVTKARAQFVGHYQPRLPGDLGFYDLRIPEVLEQQAILAQHYGLSAFCFHYYWFNGKRLMDKPLDSYKLNPKITFPFCVCWANENWTRRWDGKSGEVLISQEHNFDTDKLIIHDLVDLFKHPNYFRVDNRPLLVIYRADLLEDPTRTIAYWRSYSIEQGTGNPFILAAQTFFFQDPRTGGFDGAVGFPPHHMVTLPNIADRLDILNPDYKGDIYNYSDMIQGFLEKLHDYPYKFFPTVVPSWDNEARRPGSGMTLFGSTPELYGEWLRRACRYQIENKSFPERLVFVNAWNEWAEAAYLEPDRRFGYAYLQETADVLEGLNGPTAKIKVKARTSIEENIPSYVRQIHSRWPFYKDSSPLSDRDISMISKALDEIMFNCVTGPNDIVKISVIIPVFNHLDTTLNCLKSIGIASDKTRIEIIVIDDGSSDITQSVLSQLNSIKFIRNANNIGFLLSCNKAAEMASGELICFLNNDTMVLPGWVDNIVETFNKQPRAGLIGSKLYYPDGRLQEVGGLIWNDGGGTNFGRSDDPKKPEYCYLRDVDYCSGAAIFLPKKVWKELKGFDPIFKPAYYEDTDLAFRVRRAGYRVLVQPFSKVVHSEGISSGTDTSSGVKHYQAVNKETFYQRWKNDLASHNNPHNPTWLTNNHQKRKRVLVIDVRTPKPDVDSGSIDTFNYLISLRKLAFDVTFISTDDSDVVDGYVINLQSQGIHCLYPPYFRNIEQFIREFGKQFDLVILFRAPYGGRHMGVVKKYIPKAKIIFNTVDLHFLREKRAKGIRPFNHFTNSDVETTEEYEVGLMRMADISILVSEFEQSLLSHLYPDLVTTVMPIPREIPGRKFGFMTRKDIAFVGGYLHKPNVDAIHYFVKEIWPLISLRLAEVKFKIVGSNLPEEFNVYANEKIELVGFVPELGDVFDNVRLSVAPLRYGAGIKGKVVSSLSYGLPCVATSIAIEGMGLTADQNILTSDTPEAFADLVVRAYTDEELWENLSSAGLEFVKARHSIENFERNLDTLLKDLGFELKANH